MIGLYFAFMAPFCDFVLADLLVEGYNIFMKFSQ